MSEPDGDFTRFAQQTLWINSTLKRHYSPEGDLYSQDSAAHLHMALDALEDNNAARKITCQLAPGFAGDSDASRDLANWWLQNLREETALTPFQRLEELSAGPAHTHTFYSAHLGSLLTDPVHAQEAARHAYKQIELGEADIGPAASLAQAACQTLELHAPRLAAITPDVALFSHLQQAHSYQLPKLQTALQQELGRADPVHLEHCHTAAAGHEHAQALRQDLAKAYQHRLAELTRDDPAEAHACLERLQDRWDNGRPAIIVQGALNARDIFNAYATSQPQKASYTMASRIKAASSVEARRDRLAAVQENVSSLRPAAQLLFLGELHARLIAEPELVRPSREQILKLHTAFPDAGVTDELNRLALGDTVLQNSLTPPPPVKAVELAPHFIARAFARLRRGFGHH